MEQHSSAKKPRLGEAQDTISATDPFLRCANLILPWLNPQELANVSLTCKSLALISKFITFRRSLDAAHSFENLPIPFCNAVDSHPYAYFIYTPFQIPASSPPPRQWWGAAANECGSALAGTSESDGVDDNSVTKDESVPLPSSNVDYDSVNRPGNDDGSSTDKDLGNRNGLKSENESKHSLDSVSRRGCFKVSLVDESGERVSGCDCQRCEEGHCKCLTLAGIDEIANECGSGCGCGSECPNRVTQKRISVRLKIVRDEKKGWCLYADQLIKQGQFICEYAGELLTTEEARRRQKLYDKLRSSNTQSFTSALLVIREHLPSGQACLRINIDATRIGNVARFINHSCDGGNLSTVLLRSSGELLPRLCFFAARDILAGEELSFSYGDVDATENNLNNKLKCCCGSSYCFGTLPSENT